MSMDFTSRNEPSPELPESDTPLFAANPIWERSAKKKRGFGGSRHTAASAAPAASVGPVTTDPMAAPMTESEPMSAAPYTRTTTTRKNGGVPAVAIAAGVIVLGGLAAAGWYATQPHDNGVAQLTPGAPGAGALAPSTDTAPTALAVNTPPPAAPQAATPARTTTTTTTHTTRMAVATPRVRPAARAAAPSASESGVNTSAAIPDAPQPYSSTATPPAAAQSLPATPPVEPAPAPSASSPTTTTPATPAPEPATPEAASSPQ